VKFTSHGRAYLAFDLSAVKGLMERNAQFWFQKFMGRDHLGGQELEIVRKYTAQRVHKVHSGF
jgi:hypothetical protein